MPSVTILISAFNEEKIIGRKIENSLNINYPSDLIPVSYTHLTLPTNREV